MVRIASSQATSNGTSALTGNSNPSSDELEANLIKTEKYLQQQVVKAEALLEEKKQQTLRLEEKLESARSLLRSSSQSSLDNNEDLELHNAEWLQQLPEDHYIIQIAADADQQVLLDYASDITFSAPLALYPFKTNKEGAVVYGLSTGLFIVQDDAMIELPELGKLSEQHGVWVRKVADIKQQIAELKQKGIVQ